MRSFALALASLALASNARAAPAPADNRANAAATGVPSVQTTATTLGQSDLCLGLSSAAYGTPAIGFTINLAHAEKSCVRLRNARALAEFGHMPAAVQLLCRDKEVRASMKLAGTPCELVKEAP